MNYDFKTIEQKFKQLPEDIQMALTSTEVTAEIKKIADDNGLLIDQASTLFDLASYVLLGLLPSSDFVKTFSKEAGVDTKIAMQVAREINGKVFSKIRSSIQNIESGKEVADEQANETRRQDISALESAGGFNVIKEKSEMGSGDNGANVPTAADRSKILAGVENPTISREIRAKKTGDENYTEPLVDQLLSAPTARPAMGAQPMVNAEPIAPPAAQKIAPTIPSNLPTAEEPAVLPPTTSESSTPIRPIPATPSSPALKPVSPSPVAPKPAASTNKAPDSYREPVN